MKLPDCIAFLQALADAELPADFEPLPPRELVDVLGDVWNYVEAGHALVQLGMTSNSSLYALWRRPGVLEPLVVFLDSEGEDSAVLAAEPVDFLHWLGARDAGFAGRIPPRFAPTGRPPDPSLQAELEVFLDALYAPGRPSERRLAEEYGGVAVTSEKSPKRCLVLRELVFGPEGRAEDAHFEARATPRMAAGAVDGFTLSGVVRGTLVDRVGFRDGHVVHSVNGLPLTSVDQARAAREQLRDASELTFAVSRGRGRTRLDFTITLKLV